MFDRHQGGDRALLVHLDDGGPDADERREEFRLLAQSAELDMLDFLTGRLRRPDPARFAGRGKVEEIAAAVAMHEADVVVFDHDLSPAQERNLERELKCRVVDRTTLILDIFARRAQSAEGKLQVELAQLNHMATRLVRGWTHLERQKGGIGLRGPGETQLESDRRLLANRVRLLRERLDRAVRQREVRRRARTRGQVFSVSLVGYTNAGKSTLFNALTHARAYAADKLFATLDTTTRRVFVEGCGEVVLSDTVGFVHDLPHTLVAAFRATLEETVHADLLLHVVDGSSPHKDSQIEAVDKVLHEIGAQDIPRILVMNKIDATSLAPKMARDECGNIAQIWLSALRGAGLPALRQALSERCARVETSPPTL
jgi:GTP-binding protein HflX